MTNVIKELEKENIRFGITKYSIDDYVSLYEIGYLVAYSTKIKKIIKKYSLTITSTDDYLNYLFLNHIVEYKDYIQLVKEESVTIFNNMINYVDDILKQYITKDIVIYIKNNFKELLEYHDDLYRIKPGIKEKTILLIGRYLSNDKDILEYLCTNYPYDILDNEEVFDKSLKNNDLFTVLLSSDNIKKTIHLRQDRICELLIKIKDYNISLYNKLSDNYIQIAKDGFFNYDESNIGRYIGHIKEFIILLRKLRHPRFKEFEKEYQKAQETLNKSLEKTGKAFTFEIDLSPIFKMIDNTSIDIDKRLYVLTEEYDAKTKKHISAAKTILEKKEKYIIDMVSSNIQTDDVFTLSTIENVRMIMFALSKVINRLIRKNNNLDDFCKHIGLSMQSYLEEKKIEYKKEEIEIDINLLSISIKNLIKNFEQRAENKARYACFTSCEYICCLIEKYIRYIYLYENKKEYINDSETSLHTFLEDNKVANVLGIDLNNLLEYYLLSRQGVGKNIRNIISHYKNEIYSTLTYEIFCELLVLLLMLSNRIVSYLYD